MSDAASYEVSFKVQCDRLLAIYQACHPSVPGRTCSGLVKSGWNVCLIFAIEMLTLV